MCRRKIRFFRRSPGRSCFLKKAIFKAALDSRTIRKSYGIFRGVQMRARCGAAPDSGPCFPLLSTPSSDDCRPALAWACDFVHLRLHDGTRVRLLTAIDEYSRECLAIRAARSIRSADVIEVLAGLMVFRGVPDHIRSDNGPDFTARAVREWLGRVGARTLYIKPGSPWESVLRVSMES